MRENNIFSRVIGVVLAICISLVTICAGPLQCIAYATGDYMADEIVSVYISSKPYKTEYEVGENLELEGAELALCYGNGNTEYIDITEDMVSGFDNQTLGRQSITVKYQDFIAKFTVEVYVKTVTYIGISNLPYKTRYEVGENLDLEGAQIDVYYDNDYTEQIDITEDMISGFDSHTVGVKVLTVNYQGFIVKFPVEVYVKSVTSISIWHTPYKNEYSIGESFDLEGTEILVYYNNGDSEIVNVTEDMVSGFDNQTAGTQIITVTYEGFTDTFEVYVYQRENAATELNIIEDCVRLCEKTSNMDCFLMHEFLPEDSAYEAITWTSSDENIVKVGNNGYITPVSAGTATITATSEYGLTDTVTIIVSDAQEIGEGVTISTVLPKVFLSKGYKFTPSESGRYKITVSASSRLWTTVRDSKGTGITSDCNRNYQLSFNAEAGETYYFINSTEMGDEVDVNYTISLSKVIVATQLNIIEDRVKLCEQTSDMRCGLQREFLPEGSAYEPITWTSSDENIVKVQDGYITPVSAGTAIITATSVSGLTDTVTIEVSAAQEINIGESISATIPAECLSIGYKFTPTESGRYAVTINSNYRIGTTVRLKNTYDSPIVSSTDYNYTLAFNAEAGNTYYFINDTQMSSNVDATYTISLDKTECITSVEISQGDSFEGYEGETYYLNAVQYPLGAGRESVEWTSSDSNVVYVRNYDGWIELRSAGTAVITVTTESGFTDTCTVTVKEDPVARIELVKGTSYEYIENYNGYYDIDYNGNEYFYYYTNDHSDAVIKIIYKDGTYTTAHIGERVDGIYLNAYGWTQYDSHWTLGSENYVEITYLNSTCKMPVTVKKNPVEKLEFVSGDVSIVENTGYYTSIYDPEKEEYIKYYCYSYSQFYSDIYVKIVYTDSSFEIVNLQNSVDGYYFNFNDEQHKNPWCLGSDNYFTVSYLNKSVNVSVTIVESPVEKIELVSGEATFIENTGGYENSYYDEETDEYIDYYYYSYYSVLNDLSVEIIYKDGSSKVVNLANNYVDGYYLRLNDEQDINPWVLGSDNYFTVSYLGASLQIPVTIVESPVERIEIIKSPTKVYVFGDEIYGYTYDGEYWFTPDDFNGIEFIVYYKNGTSKTFASADIDKYGRIGEYYCVCEHLGISETGEYDVTFSYMGVDSEAYTINVIENNVASIDIVKMPERTVYPYTTDYIGMQVKINYLSGESEIITFNRENVEYTYYYDIGLVEAFVSVGDNQMLISSNMLGIDDRFVTFLGASQDFFLPAPENREIEDVIVKEISPAGDGIAVGMTIDIIYVDGEKETVVIDNVVNSYFEIYEPNYYYNYAITDKGFLYFDVTMEYSDNKPSKYVVCVCGREIEIEVDESDKTVGDINGDGFIGVADLTVLRNALISGADDTAYDVNGDNVFDARDVVALKKIVSELSCVCGDVDGDGNVNASDLAILRNLMLDTESFDETETAVYDVSENGIIDAADLVRLKKQIAD